MAPRLLTAVACVAVFAAAIPGLSACASKPKTELPPEKEGVQDAVASHVGDVSDCYTAALKRNPKLNGKMILEWEVNPIGHPRNIKIIQHLDKKLDQCMVDKVSDWTFEPPPEGKVAKIRYPFVFAPADPLKEVKGKTFEIVATPKPDNFKKCPQIEAEYAALCVRDADTGECTIDQKPMGELLQLMRSSPQLEMSYLADLDKMLKNPKASPKEIEAILAKLNADCWTEIHSRMWNSIFYTFKNMPTHSRRAEAKEVLGNRTTSQMVHSPTVLALSQDLAILERAVESGFIKLTGPAKKDLVFLSSKTKALRKAVNKDWGIKEGGDGKLSWSPTENPGKTVVLIRKELKAVKPLRAQLKEWSRKYWKKL
jgi:hypothetical protein